MEKHDIQKKIYSKIDEIPTLPAVIPRLLKVMEDQGASAADMADAISTDPALTAKILKVANSAYYGFSREILSLKLAISLLGRNMVKSLALSIGVINSLPNERRSPNFSDGGLWVHSLAAATLMQDLGKRFGDGKEAEHFFIIGLLHDIGKVVLNQYFNELFQKALEEAADGTGGGLHEAESRLIGFDHGQVGAMLLTRWKFPRVISDTIAAHHKSDPPGSGNGRDLAMLRIANTIPQEIGLGQEGNPVPPLLSEDDLNALGMGEKEVEEMRLRLTDMKEQIHALFDAMV